MKPILLITILLLGGVIRAGAETISVPDIDTATYWGPGATGGGQAYGESFVVPAGSPVLNSFTFTSLDSTSGSPISFQNEIYSFDPVYYTTPGSSLYVGPVLTVPATGEITDTFTPNLVLTPGATYIAFITPTGISQASPTAYGEMGANGSQPYLDGHFFFAETGGSTDVNSYVWQTYSGNAAFTAYFGTAIPEPSSWFLTLGALAVLTVRRLKKLALQL